MDPAVLQRVLLCDVKETEGDPGFVERLGQKQVQGNVCPGTVVYGRSFRCFCRCCMRNGIDEDTFDPV